MSITEAKKHEYWNHFVSVAFTESALPNRVTPARLRKIKPRIWDDEYFWFTVIERNGGESKTPEELEKFVYGNSEQNFWGMIRKHV